MMCSFHDVYGVCTALHLNGLGNLDAYATNSLLSWIETSIPRGLASAIGANWEGRKLNGFALIFAISTDDQRCSRTMEKLGFTKCFEAEKSHDHSRETDSGALTMWCVQPWVFEEKRQAFIAELKAGDKPTAEEVARRQAIDEFRITHYQSSDIMIPHMGGASRLYRKDLIPFGIADRNRIFGLIATLTGGYEPGKDPEIVEAVAARELNWGLMKDRAIRWRNGEFK